MTTRAPSRLGGRPALAILAAVAALAGPAAACLWDRDTLAAEAEGLPDVIRIVTGRFERNPAAYYEMRLERSSAIVARDPDDLDAYDDAAVAADRLGRSGEAIDWMARKRARLEAAGPRADVDTHWYRYEANLGTFHAHRWIRAGADRARPADLEAARDHVAAAIRRNPDAHFGREEYQLEAIEWLLDPAGRTLAEAFGFDDAEMRASLKEESPEAARAVRGLSGLIALGDAWESVDVFHALAAALLVDGRTKVAFLASYRGQELIDAGRRSLAGEAGGRRVVEELDRVGRAIMPAEQKPLLRQFRRLRAEADAWQAGRHAYMEARLAEGRHPDTDPEFWEEFSPSSPPPLDAKETALEWAFGGGATDPDVLGSVLAIGLVLLIPAGAVALAIRARRRDAGRRVDVQRVEAPAGSAGPESPLHL